MKQKILFWSIAVLLTIFLAIYQRVTGPTYPLKGEFAFDNKTVKYDLPRSSEGAEHTFVRINIDDPLVTGKVSWKRLKTNDTYSVIEMKLNNGKLEAELPIQPTAGKLEYNIALEKKGETVSIPGKSNVVIRFRDSVPAIVLIPHILIIFLAMLLSTRAGLEFFNPAPKLRKYTLWTIVLLFLGGFVFGPLMQYYAFGAFWTGIPFGFDLTDNKTLIAMIAWLIVWWRLNKSKNPKRLVLIGAIVMFLVYLIPHSVLGSELDYSKMDKNNNNTLEQPLQK
jgi:hypothetical protein